MIKKYIAIGWPDIQEYMEKENYREEVFFDPMKNTWLIPDYWVEDITYLDDNDNFE